MWREVAYGARKRDKTCEFRSDFCDWKETLGECAGTSRVSEDDHSDVHD